MNLPDLITAFIKAQNNHDSLAFAACFQPDAVVFDEGKNHHGKAQIIAWIDEANENYQTLIEPLEYSGSGGTGVLSAKISGTFDGSPIELKYHFEFSEELIQSLKIAS